MIELSPRAQRHVARLAQHYDSLDRDAAVLNLATALTEAGDKSERDPAAGLPAPRPYPQLAKPGRRWLHVRRYWIASDRVPLCIVAVFYDRANIPKRL
ncbi:MAG: hypothetical protein WCC64_01315 [Aliidongia sp.]